MSSPLKLEQEIRNYKIERMETLEGIRKMMNEDKVIYFKDGLSLDEVNFFSERGQYILGMDLGLYRRQDAPGTD